MSSFEESEFNKFESKVNNVMKILEDMNSPDQIIQEKGIKEADRFLGADDNDIDESSFIVKIRDNRTVINTKQPSYENAQQMDKFTFMQQVEQDAEKRAEMKREKEKIAENFRKLKSIGNDSFRKEEYEKAIGMYTKAIDHVKDSPILYNNRALSYIKLQMYKRAIIDCDFVINKIDEKNLRAWLYRAIAYYNLDDEKNYETSVKMAKKNNSKEIEYIEKFIENIKNKK